MKDLIKQITKQTQLSSQQAWWLLEFVTNKNRSQLQFATNNLLPEQQVKLNEILNLITKHHKPLAYILGWIPFLNLKLEIHPPILIPRPETEDWLEKLITQLQNYTQENLTILDIGTGSGCIALSLAQSLPKAQIFAVDINPQAIELAQKNAQINNLSNITFIQSDLFAAISHNLQFDLIVSNPPYIDPAAHLEYSVLNWEDHAALFAPNNGLQIIEQIAQQAKRYLKKNNKLPYQLIMEIDVSHSKQVQKILEHNGFTNIHIQKDQFDRDRTIWAS